MTKKKRSKFRGFRHRGRNFQKQYYDQQVLEQSINMRISMLEKIAADATYQIIGVTMFLTCVPCLGYLINKWINKKVDKYKYQIRLDALKQQQVLKEKKRREEVPKEGTREGEEKTTKDLAQVIKEERKVEERIIKCPGCDQTGGTLIKREDKYWHEECYKITKEEGVKKDATSN